MDDSPRDGRPIPNRGKLHPGNAWVPCYACMEEFDFDEPVQVAVTYAGQHNRRWHPIKDRRTPIVKMAEALYKKESRIRERKQHLARMRSLEAMAAAPAPTPGEYSPPRTPTGRTPTPALSTMTGGLASCGVGG
ncbi:MAG: hypothetical protein ACKVQA_26365 [Burkholderiales bacterium]